MPIVAMPDGTQVQFPDEMPADQIRSLILSKFPDADKPPTPSEGVNAGISNFAKFAGETASNIPASAGRFAVDMVQPVLHPVDTAENVYSLGKGILQKFGIVSGTDSEKYADAVGQFFKDRYGGSAEIAKTIKEDPVGVLADLSTILTAGGAATVRAPGAVGKIGEAAAAAGRAVDPLNAVAGTAKLGGKLAAEIAGVTTGAGSEAIKTAARAGAEGGDAARAFREGMSGTNTASVVNEAKSAVAQLREERGTTYREAMAEMAAKDATFSPADRVLDFGKIDKSIDKVSTVKTFKGQDLSPTTKDIRSDILNEVNDWKKLPPADFHTAEGLDALKQKVGDIVYGKTQTGTPARVIGEQIYHGIRDTIVEYAPEYAKIMKGYEQATGILREIESTLSLKPNANIDTSLRKLQSVLRNNVNTNYGRRAELVDFLTRAGAPHLMEKLSGQALSSATPRGLARVGALGEGASAAAALAGGHIGVAAALAGTALASSPALVGGIAHGLGVASRAPLRSTANTSFQLGRVNRALQ